jgi:predicted nucleic acid-binding Zn ribbon protein
MPIYTYVCPNEHERDLFRNMADRNMAILCEDCPGTWAIMMKRKGIELQKRPQVVRSVHPPVYKS